MDIPTLSTFGSLAALGGIGAAVAASWSRIRSFMTYLRSLIVIECKLDLDEVSGSLLTNHLLKYFKRISPRDVMIYYHSMPSPDPDVNYVEVQQPYYPTLFYRNKTFLLLTGADTFLFLRGTFDVKSFIEEVRKRRAEEFREKRREENGLIPDMYTYEGHLYPVEDICGTDPKMFAGFKKSSGEDIPELGSSRRGRSDGPGNTITGGSTSPRKSIYVNFNEFGALSWTKEQLEGSNREVPTPTLSKYFYPPEVLESLERFWTWYYSREWYQERGIPHQRGILLYGPAGSGKSTFAEVLASLLETKIFRFNLATLSDQEFIEKFKSRVSEWDCPIILFEDFDNVFNKREPAPGVTLTFDCVLNQISGAGINANQSRILIITTNNLEKIDPAIGQLTESGVSSRPGRADEILYIGEACFEARKAMCHKVLRDWPELEQKALSESEGMVISQVRELCVTHALKKLAETKGVINGVK